MKLLIKLRFIPKLAEIPSIKFTIKFKNKRFFLPTQGKKKNLLVNLNWTNLVLERIRDEKDRGVVEKNSYLYSQICYFIFE
jgi:hypothetical protein